MSQFDFGTIDPYVDDGVLLADDLNQWRNALYSMQRGSSRPSFAQPGQVWMSDAAGAADWQANLYTGPTRGDVKLFDIDTTAGMVALAAAMQAVTQASGTSNRTVATTEFVQQAINAAIQIALAQIFPVGSIADLPGVVSIAPQGWVLSGPGTIGNPTSGATIRANNDCQPLFLHLWNGLSQTEAPVSGGRGSSALADFNAAKTIGGLDFRGCSRFTNDAGAGRLTQLARVGQIGGQETEQTYADVTVGGRGYGATYSNLVVHTAMWTDGGNQTQYGGIVGSGDTAHGYHQHYVDGWFETQGQASVYADCNFGGGGYTRVVTNLPPARVVTTIVKL